MSVSAEPYVISAELYEVMDTIGRLKPEWKADFVRADYPEYGKPLKKTDSPYGNKITSTVEATKGLVDVVIETSLDRALNPNDCTHNSDHTESFHSSIQVRMSPWKDSTKKEVGESSVMIFDKRYVITYSLVVNKSILFGTSKFFQQRGPTPPEYLYLRDYVNSIIEPLFMATLAEWEMSRKAEQEARQSLKQECVESFFDE